MSQKEICCNACGRKLVCRKGILREDALFVEKKWGYFSEKDLEIHEFAICESCYDRMTAAFVRPIAIKKKKEVLDET